MTWSLTANDGRSDYAYYPPSEAPSDGYDHHTRRWHWRYRSGWRSYIDCTQPGAICGAGDKLSWNHWAERHRNTIVALFTILLVVVAVVFLDHPLYRSTGVPYLRHPTGIKDISPSMAVAQFGEEQEGVVYHPFPNPPPSQFIADDKIRPIQVHEAISDPCLDIWVASGVWEGACVDVDLSEQGRIDLVYIWVNGSDPLHQLSRSQYTTPSAPSSSTSKNPKNARFREHDELRHSFRASLQASKGWGEGWTGSQWHLVTADVPHPNNSDVLLGLVPQWLDVNNTMRESPRLEPRIWLHHVSQIFKLIDSTTDGPITEEDAQEWREHVLPSFNSFAVESQLANLDPTIVSDNIVSLNDDQYIILPSAPSTFHSPLYGPVLRFDRAFQVVPDPTGSEPGDGEWRSLKWSSYLLSKRFGERPRSYVVHNARALSLPLLHEASLTFPHPFSSTPLSRFRGWHAIPGEFEVNTMFLATHYIIERKREALLWSWVVAKWGNELSEQKGFLTSEVKDAMWKELGASRDEIRLDELRTTRQEDIEINFLLAGLTPPRSQDPTRSSTTNYWSISQDGYPTRLNGASLPQSLSRSECLGFEGQTAFSLFRSLLVDNPLCGDSIIHALVRSAPSGLGIFLPSGGVARDGRDPLTLPLQLPPQPSSAEDEVTEDVWPIPHAPRALRFD